MVERLKQSESPNLKFRLYTEEEGFNIPYMNTWVQGKLIGMNFPSDYATDLAEEIIQDSLMVFYRKYSEQFNKKYFPPKVIEESQAEQSSTTPPSSNDFYSIVNFILISIIKIQIKEHLGRNYRLGQIGPSGPRVRDDMFSPDKAVGMDLAPLSAEVRMVREELLDWVKVYKSLSDPPERYPLFSVSILKAGVNLSNIDMETYLTTQLKSNSKIFFLSKLQIKILEMILLHPYMSQDEMASELQLQPQPFRVTLHRLRRVLMDAGYAGKVKAWANIREAKERKV
jgi:hypothetical protein